jgi:predicted AAA+ superfamily ATPase
MQKFTYQQLRFGVPAFYAGASWEGYVAEQIAACKDQQLQMHYYRTHDGAECDIVLVKGIKPVACIEIKLSNAPQVSKGF